MIKLAAKYVPRFGKGDTVTHQARWKWITCNPSQVLNNFTYNFWGGGVLMEGGKRTYTGLGAYKRIS